MLGLQFLTSKSIIAIRAALIAVLGSASILPPSRGRQKTTRVARIARFELFDFQTPKLQELTSGSPFLQSEQPERSEQFLPSPVLLV